MAAKLRHLNFVTLTHTAARQCRYIHLGNQRLRFNEHKYWTAARSGGRSHVTQYAELERMHGVRLRRMHSGECLSGQITGYLVDEIGRAR